jgi:hypothetical protein
MRHDEHYVEALAASAGDPVGRIVPIELLDPNPNQPRQVMGDLSELMASVAEKGIIEPLIVRQRGARYQIIAANADTTPRSRSASGKCPSSSVKSTMRRSWNWRWSRTFSARI